MSLQNLQRDMLYLIEVSICRIWYYSRIQSQNGEEFAVKYPYLFNYTTEVERKALCEACEDDEDTLMEWDDQTRRYERGEFVRSDFVIALHESIDAEENALLEYAKRYKKFVLSENQTGRLY